ncbi:MAG: argininosuccinate lyase [Nitrospirae bacterium]|nr:MAG: argininosuccinate lyase [Nitrospirota bacterium]
MSGQSPKRSSPLQLRRGKAPITSNRVTAVTSNSPTNKPWGGRFREATRREVEQFTTSLPFDWQLYEYDIQGSLAHCQALAQAHILTRKECQAISRGLKQVRQELHDGTFPFLESDEDIHMAIERRLRELIGPLGGKLHTGRSRNDQVTLDLRLYLRDAIQALIQRLEAVELALLDQAKRHIDVILPGYTHLQRAQPVLLAHHLLAYVEMFERDKARLCDARTRVNVMPLGSGALAGTNYPLDRQMMAQRLHFPDVTRNSLDAVSDRDYVVEVLGALSILMMHLSRLSEELVLWSTQEFGFLELPDGFCTGSSMMPQKKNPDVPELVRGKTGRVYGHLLSVLTMLKGLPLSYNRDLQEDKEPLFDAVATVHASLAIFAELVRRLRINREKMAEAAESGELLATELADYLVLQGVPFREAHHLVGRLVQLCQDKGKDLRDLTLAELQTVSPYFEADVAEWLTPMAAINRKNQLGGTARKQVESRIRLLQKQVKRTF